MWHVQCPQWHATQNPSLPIVPPFKGDSQREWNTFFPRDVWLAFINPDTKCHSEASDSQILYFLNWQFVWPSRIVLKLHRVSYYLFYAPTAPQSMLLKTLSCAVKSYCKDVWNGFILTCFCHSNWKTLC